jgi:hypothetical protein
MFLINSHLDQFSATHLRGHPFSRSYGARLPSSLTRVVSIALGLSSPPTRVGLRYGRYCFKGNEAFLDGIGLAESHWVSPQLPATFSYNVRGGFTCPGLTYSGRHTMSDGYAQLALPCPPFASTAAVRE